MYLLTLILTWLVIQVWGGIAVLQRDDLQRAGITIFKFDSHYRELDGSESTYLTVTCYRGGFFYRFARG